MSDEQKSNVRKNLLKYYALDTLAMVELYKKLKEESGGLILFSQSLTNLVGVVCI